MEANGNIVESDQQKSDILNDFFVKQSTIYDSSSWLPEYIPPTYEPRNHIEISRNDVIQAIKGLNISKASGPDLISPKLIKKCIQQLADLFTQLFKLSTRLKNFRDPSKDSKVMLVHKKDSMSDPNNYRLISLLSNVGKLMERCIHKHLNEYLKDQILFALISQDFKVTILLLINYCICKIHF